ncbi:hypothetical protein K503DRAFT_858837 [Rhizopogon vinicolor AM-OR11-026]|uniref:DUF6533 domain-containing protein n=1 Tax=Rhizopogon vinicolor AM-OR11-026 TaxID=1314800 RepID=A0A1B7MR45_9AGAM|nr:hypothetical protein K503DRAFT_858837 [Rhizopogon vinicolor AM-OR11-026]
MYSTEDIVELERVFLNLKYASVVVTSCWAYDYFLTISDEVAFLTQSQWKWAKFLYLVCRYLTCVFLTLTMLVAFQLTMSIQMCQVLYSVNTYLGGVIMLCAEGVFLARTCAIWEFRRRMMVIFLINGAMYVIISVIVLSLGRASPTITKSPIPLTSCFYTGDNVTIIIVYVLLAVLEIQIWCFTVYKAATSYWLEGTHNRLLEQLIHHNVIYVTCGLVFSLAVILTTVLIKESDGFMIGKFVRVWQVTVHAFLVTKMSRGLWRTAQRRAYQG